MVLISNPHTDHPMVNSIVALKILWLGVAVTFFTFAASFLKFGLTGRINLTLPHVLTLSIAGIGLASVLVGHCVIRKPVMEKIPGRLIIISMLGLVLVHLIGTPRAYDDLWALRESFKITLGFLTFWCIVVMYPDDRKFEEKFWLIAVSCSVVAVGIMMYRYYSVFNSSYLGDTWGEKTRAGRNLLGWYLALLVPIAYAGALLSRQRVLMFAAACVLIVACFYTGSRSSIGLMSVGIAIVSALALGHRHTRKSALIGISFGMTTSAGLVIYRWSTFVEHIENSEMYLRLIDFVASEGGSASVRGYLIERAWECFREGPLLYGIGVKNVVICVGQGSSMTKEMVVHNDYLSILADMGLVGFLFFLTTMLSILYVMVRRFRLRAANITWVDMGLFAAAVLSMIYLNLSTGYNSPLLWSILGFAVVSSKVPINEGAHP